MKHHSNTDAYGTAPDLLIYAGLRAEKYLANHAPEKELELIMQAEENKAKIKPKRLVLISTIDVFPAPNGVNEFFQDHWRLCGFQRNRDRHGGKSACLSHKLYQKMRLVNIIRNNTRVCLKIAFCQL